MPAADAGPNHTAVGTTSPPATLGPMAEASEAPLDQQLEEIRTQLGWVRDYL
jgi:hypothetical protein